MESLQKLPQPSEMSQNNISKVLSRNMLGLVLQFVQLSDLPTVGKLNKKFRDVIRDEKKLPLFKEYIEEKSSHAL